MRRNPLKRLGGNEQDAEDVKRQSFFRVKTPSQSWLSYAHFYCICANKTVYIHISCDLQCYNLFSLQCTWQGLHYFHHTFRKTACCCAVLLFAGNLTLLDWVVLQSSKTYAFNEVLFFFSWVGIAFTYPLVFSYYLHLDFCDF